MPRVIRHPEVRRAEILDVAFKIFLERGYDNTSLNEVIESAGMSKGMFYHHFASKEALLAAIFERVTDQTYQMLEGVLSEKGVDPTDRLQNVLTRAAEIRLQTAEVTRSVFTSLHRPESHLLYERISDAWSQRMRPILTKIIEEGVKAKSFKTPDPEGVADLILQMGIATRYLLDAGMIAKTARERDEASAILARRLSFHAVTLGRILGVPDGRFVIGPPDFAHRLIAALNPIRPARKSK